MCSLMAVSGRSSVFTFESSVHSRHVLRSLNEQRSRDVLCDVTVVAEGQSFRAHRSVLASCSEYFSQRISSLTDHNVVVTLPPEVTAAGFEPLLKFAYTSKLLFGKEDVLDIQTSASVLGFKDLDGACFDFLLPKFFSSTKASFVRKTCCKKKCKRLLKDSSYIDLDELLLDDKEVKPVADSPSQEEASVLCNKSVNIKSGSQIIVRPPTPVTEGANDNVKQCPKYRKFQLACGKEACAAEKSQQHPVTVTKPDYDPPCPSQNETGNCFLKLSGQVEEMVNNGRGNLVDEKNKTEGTNDKKLQETEIQQQQQQHTEASCNVKESAVGQGHGSTGLVSHHCTQEAFCKKQGIIGSVGQQRSVINFGEDDKKTSDLSTPKKGSMLQAKGQLQETGFMESTEQGEGCAQQQSDVCVQDSDAKCSSDAAKSTSDWLNIHLNLSSSFLQDLDRSTSCWKGAGCSDFEGASQSGVSSLNSGEDSETEAEGYSEAYARERAKQVQLPYPVDQIVEMSRNDFQELLDKQVFTREQLDLVRDMRRRSKNRLAAQRCRKRKLDCIYNLQCEINKLKTEREKLLREKSQLSQMKSETCHSVSALCQRVCSEANLQPEQLQVLAKYTSADCPLTSYVPSIDSLLSPQPKPIPQPSSTGRPEEDFSCSNSQHPGTTT